MLTNRQYQILKELEQSSQEFYKGSRLANTIGCSLKTLQNDIKVIKEALQECHCTLVSLTSKGYQLQISNIQEYEAMCNQYQKGADTTIDFNNPDMRVTYILTKLFAHNGYTKLENLADEMFVSRASAALDLKQGKQILAKYNLEIIHRPNLGIRISGLEKDKRTCIVKQRLPLHQKQTIYSEEEEKKQMIAQISDVIADTLMRAHYKISDLIFQNLVLHIYVAIHRMMEKEYLEKEGKANVSAHEILLAKAILEQLQTQYAFTMQDSEVQNLAIHLLGKRSYEHDELITTQTDTLVNDVLILINEKIGIDLSADVELRISLALHFVPLLARLQSNMQLENAMVDKIKQHYTLAFDMATLASSYLMNCFHIPLIQDEVAYLAVHFNLALQTIRVKENPKKVLIICNSRRGDSLLLQHTFYKHFSELIEKLTIINALEVPYYAMDEYDCVFATFLNHEHIPKCAIRINFFLEDSDINRIRRTLQGEQEMDILLQYFHPSLFFASLTGKKDAILKQMCEAVMKCADFDENLYDAVMKRESLGFTTFGNGIAVPHPEALISKQTIVSVGICKQPIDWGDQKVQLIFLVCVEKGNQKDLRSLFECISQLIMNPDSIEMIVHHHDYDTLIRKLGSVLP